MTTEQRQEARQRVKGKLGEYVPLEKERKQLLDELAKLEAKRHAPGTSNWDAMPRGSGAGDAMSGGLIQKENIVDRYNRKVQEMEAVQAEIEDMIEGLSCTERKLMRHRYIEGLTWEKVCVEMNYSWRQTHNIHAAALDRLIEKVMPEA